MQSANGVRESLKTATLFHQRGELQAAEHVCREILEKVPQNAETLHLLGLISIQTGKLEIAVDLIQLAIAVKPKTADFYHNLGVAYWKMKNFKDASQSYRRALQLKPDNTEAHNNLGVVLHTQGELDEAVERYERALQLNPNFAEAHCNLGNALRDQEKLEEAVAHYERALRIKPNLAVAYLKLGAALRAQGKLDEAVERYERALQLNPNFAEAHCRLASAQLLGANFKAGWEECEWRWKKNATQPRFPMLQWDGTSLEKKTILVFAEQGVGDEIMFASCLPDVIATSKQCVVECDRRLVPLFERSFPKAVFLAKLADCNSEASNILSSVDVQCGIGSLPRWTRRTVKDFPNRDRYLETDSSLREKWNSRLAELGDGLKVGISWRGGSDADIRRIRSTTLDQWKTLFEIPGVHFVNLQYGECSAELQEAKNDLGIAIHDWDDADPFSNLDDFAAQIAELDLVISVDNSTVHMAGAVGVPVWTLLPFDPNWRWMLNREDNPWYPTMKLYRQQERGKWEPVYERVAADLQKFVENSFALQWLD